MVGDMYLNTYSLHTLKNMINLTFKNLGIVKWMSDKWNSDLGHTECCQAMVHPVATVWSLYSIQW